MKQYRIRPGIYKVSICGSRFLIPTRKASEECPSILKMNVMQDLSWDILEKNTFDEARTKLIKMLLLLTKTSEEKASERVDHMIDSLYHMGFLVLTEESE